VKSLPTNGFKGIHDAKAHPSIADVANESVWKGNDYDWWFGRWTVTRSAWKTRKFL